MGIFAGHAPVLSTLRPGVVVVTKEGGATDRIFVRGGFAEVNPQGLTLLAETAIPLAELDAAAIAQQVKNAEEDFADAVDAEVQAQGAGKSRSPEGAAERAVSFLIWMNLQNPRDDTRVFCFDITHCYGLISWKA